MKSFRFFSTNRQFFLGLMIGFAVSLGAYIMSNNTAHSYDPFQAQISNQLAHLSADVKDLKDEQKDAREDITRHREWLRELTPRLETVEREVQSILGDAELVY